MNRFELARADSVAQARELADEKAGGVLKAGGIDLLDHLKEHLLEPPRLVDLKRITGLDGIEVLADGGLRIGPLATLAAVAAHDGVRKTHAALAQACGLAASPQIRNVATIGGNLLQRPRCWYYRLESYPCLKKGGDECFAVSGENRYHSILGGGPCVALHPSNAASRTNSPVLAQAAANAGTAPARILPTSNSQVRTGVASNGSSVWFIFSSTMLCVANTLAINAGISRTKNWNWLRMSRRKPSVASRLLPCGIVTAMREGLT